ncbi:exosortase/archaeosortase family protein [Coraliomargarita sp. SDUM461004]|uniref:Exosortase/archaeosortase family protein n=1 Tax=Thalassobacterium sedimentorum TaxID=3041258 RepID=A0ABU1ARI3_9BACT|nr:exosortase/archaeosortase family protein [Coraliomargarita sp. SDUM461004]MDQ8196223.1 exosortase/archaeosortase family protein [Coraliomargarita sp. SDUM461004]
MTTKTNNPSFKNLLPEQIWTACLLLGFTLYTIWDQLFWWSNREDYSFGYLVPLFAAYVVYDRWPVMRHYLFGTSVDGVAVPATGAVEAAEPARGVWVTVLEWIAIAGFAASLLLFGVGALLRAATGPQNPASLAIAASLAGLTLSGIFIFTKERVDGQPMPLKQRLALTALFLFPALIWMISAPLVSVLETKIRVFLLTKVTIIVFHSFDFLGYELEREGNVLILPQGQVGVEEACSGIRSLTACLFAGSFLASVFLDRFWKKILLVCAAMVFAVLTNLIRSIFLTLWAYHHGSQAIDDHWVLPLLGDIGSVHDVTGFAILGFTCVGLICLLPIFNFKLQDFDEEPDWGASDPTEAKH